MQPAEAPAERNAAVEALYASLPADVRAARTSSLIDARGSDRQRWGREDNLKPDWSSRAGIAARLLTGMGTVLDLGCGRMDLERALPADARYVPADLVARDARTIVCDLNAGELPTAPADVVTMLGVVEYIHDVEGLFLELGRRWPRMVFSYNPADLDVGRNRRAHGWFNDLRLPEIVEKAVNAGFDLQAIVPVDARQRLFDFQVRAA